MPVIKIKQFNAALAGSDDYQPHVFVVTQDGKTMGHFYVGEYPSPEEAKAAAQALADKLEADPWVSPFHKHRGILLGTDYGTALRLQALCLHLWNGEAYKVDMGRLLANSDAEHRAIAFELMQSYALLGENDRDFMTLCEELRASRCDE